jgi:NAD(P)-dependent dehydrogenase (short-subunit alcohol dehydrogenase family)
VRQFEGKVILITGGTSGIGLATAMIFARRGGLVVVSGRDPARGESAERAIAAAGGEAKYVRADVSRPADVEALVAKTAGLSGRLDCAFNNAATEEGAFKLTTDFTEDEFDRSVGVNLKGVWLCMQREIRQMLRQEPPGGAIVNTSSVNGLGGTPMGSLYSATKAGVLALTKAAAQEFAPQGIRVNTLVAGAFRTPMLERVFDRASGGDAASRESVEAAYAERIPLGRIGRPEEAAEAVVWLCSTAATFVTGHSMIVDGGMTAWSR